MNCLHLRENIYQKLGKLLQVYLSQAGILYLKLVLDIQSCQLCETLKKLTVIESLEQHKKKNIKNVTYSELTYQFEQILTYRGQSIGEMVLTIPCSGFPSSHFTDVFELLPTKIINLLTRRKLEIESVKQFGHAYSWIGNSESLFNFEKSIEHLSNQETIVVIHGEPCSGKIIAALSIHVFGQNSDQPFIISNCLDWNKTKYNELIESLLFETSNGTLYLRHFDLLDDELQKKVLKKILKHTQDHSVYKTKNHCRLIFSVQNTSTNIGSTFEGTFIRDSVSQIRLPSLNQRTADIKALGIAMLTNLNSICFTKLDDICWQYLQQIKWGTGFEQLELLMFKLVNFCNKSNIDLQALITQLSKMDINTESSLFEIEQKSISGLAKDIAGGKVVEIYDQHPAVNKAIAYVANNFDQCFDLSTLARNSCVSPSHLSSLLRKRLNTNFKQFLNLCRIEKSIIFLRENPNMQVTEISASLGFCDLSHFEKTFKRQTGNTPKEFRKTRGTITNSKMQLVRNVSSDK